jgi:type II secretion system protein H
MRGKSSGFTLIELMVVVAIIALVSGLVMPSINSMFKVSLNSTARNLANTIKETYNSTVVTGNVHRIVYDFKAKQFWVEVGPSTALLESKESKERDAKRRSIIKEKDKDKNEDKNGGFLLARSVTRKKQNLPAGVEFEDILTQQSPDPAVDGTAFTHFFPNGLAEQTIVRIKDSSDHHASLVISPLLGRTDVYDRYLKPEEAFPK